MSDPPNPPRTLRAGDVLIAFLTPVPRPPSASDATYRDILRHPGQYAGGIASIGVGGPLVFLRAGTRPDGSEDPERYGFAVRWDARRAAPDLRTWESLSVEALRRDLRLDSAASLVAWANDRPKRYAVSTLDAAGARQRTERLQRAVQTRAA